MSYRWQETVDPYDWEPRRNHWDLVDNYMGSIAYATRTGAYMCRACWEVEARSCSHCECHNRFANTNPTPVLDLRWEDECIYSRYLNCMNYDTQERDRRRMAFLNTKGTQWHYYPNGETLPFVTA